LSICLKTDNLRARRPITAEPEMENKKARSWSAPGHSSAVRKLGRPLLAFSDYGVACAWMLSTPA
jgi:hypothetical protein